MKRTHSFSAKALCILLAAIMSLSMLNGAAILSHAADTGDTYVFIPIKDLSNASRYEGGSIATNFMDTSIGGTPECGNYTLLLQAASDFVEYDIDLDDSVTNAVLKVHSMSAVVSVKAAGGEFVTLTAKNGGAADRGVNLFDLTEANALASNDNRFTVRLGSQGGAVVLNGMAVVAEQPELAKAYSLNPLGESYLQNVVDVSAGATRYFLDATVPTIYLHSGEYVTFYFDFADNAESISYGYVNAGDVISGAISTDGAAWTALPSASGNVEDVISLPANKAFYVRFSAEAGETFLRNLELSPKFTNKVGAQFYMPLNSLSAANEYGGTGLFENFNDSFTGGDDNTVNNKTLLLQAAGDYISYNMDMDDGVTSAQLKLYITGGKVEVQPEGGEFVTLTAKNGGGFNRNIAIFDLTEADALAAASNKFTLRISYDGSTVVLNSLLIQAGIPELNESYSLNPLGESYLQNVVDVSASTTRYFANGNEPTVFLHNGEHVTLYFDFTDDAMSVLYAYAQLGNPLTAEVSTDGGSWTPMPSASGKIEDIISLPANKAFYVRFTATAGDAFLQSVTLSPVTAAYTDAGAELYLPLHSLSVANQYGGTGLLENYNDTYLDGGTATNPTLLLQAAGDFVEYRLDMYDTVTAAQLKLYITGGKVEVKPAGGEFITLTAKNGSAFNRNVAIFDLTEADALAADDNKFILRISYDGSTVVLNSLLVQAQTTKISGAYELEVLGESYLQNIVDVSVGATRYFMDGNIPTVFLHTGEHVTFYFDFVDEAKGVLTSFTQAGTALTAEVSTDDSVWTPIASGAYVENMAFYLRFTAAEGDSFLSGLTLQAHNHNYSNWMVTKHATVTDAGQREKFCAACGDKIVEEIPKVDSPIYAWNIALGDDIGVKFYAKMSDADAENAVMYFTVAGETIEAAASKAANSDYVFCANVAAAQMNDTIQVSLVMNGETTDCGQYSVRGYAEVILNGSYNDSTKNLVKAMLNYGAKAQTYFNYNAGSLANAGYEMDAAVAVPTESAAVSVTGSIAGLRFYGASLVYTSKVAVRFYFNADNLNGITFEVGQTAYEAVEKEAGLYYVEITGINPQDYDTLISLVASNGTGTLTVGYSPMHYITRKYNNAESSDALKDLLLAMYNYYDAANKYVPENA